MTQLTLTPEQLDAVLTQCGHKFGNDCEEYEQGYNSNQWEIYLQKEDLAIFITHDYYARTTYCEGDYYTPPMYDSEINNHEYCIDGAYDREDEYEFSKETEQELLKELKQWNY